MVSARSSLISCIVAALFAFSGCGGGGGGTSGDSTSVPPSATPPTTNSLQFGAREDLLFWTQDQQRVGYRNMDLIFSTRGISHSSGRAVFDLPSAPIDLSKLSYQYQGQTFTLTDFIANERVAGMLVLKDGSIVYEHYDFGHSANAKWTSFSISKSVVSLLIGVAINEGSIASVNDPVTLYLPQLRGSAYEGVTIKNLLQMSSGTGWNEDYTNAQSDVGRIGAVMRDSGTDGLLKYMAGLPRVASPGQRFNYNTGETHLAGALLAAAVKDNLSNYLSRKLWSAFAMEADAFWVTASDGGPETAGCCISATLRDYGRIGQFVLRNGMLGDGTQILPTNWIANSAMPSTAYPGYGYLWWLLGSGDLAAIGIFGQTIEIYPQQKIVIVTQSFWPEATNSDLSGHRIAVSNAIRTALTK